MSSFAKVIFTALGFMMAVPAAWSAPTYSFTLIDLDTFQTIGSQGPIINDLGEIAFGNGIRSTSGTWSLLSPLGSPDPGPGYSEIRGINNTGQAVGLSSTTSPFYASATIWNSGSPAAVDDGSARGSALVGINDAGQYIGNANASAGYHYIIGNTPMGSGDSFGPSTAYAINASGHVAGTDITHANFPSAQATLWTASTRTVLDTRTITDGDGNVVAYWGSLARDINDLDQVVGYADYADGTRATLWDSGTQTDLGALGSSSFSNALAINNAGQIVGESDGHAFLYQDAALFDLNTLVSSEVSEDGWLLSSATDINAKGWIVGTLNSDFGFKLFLLKPIAAAVPEPHTWILLLAGVACVVFRKRLSIQPNAYPV